MSENRIDLGTKFASFILSEEEVTLALKGVGPLFHCYLQNKIASYANQLVEEELPYDPDPQKQVAAIIRVENLRAQIRVMQELQAEILTEQSRSN